MANKNYHPRYIVFQYDWEKCSDALAGERTVKDRGTKYLPATDGQVLDGMGSSEMRGQKNYEGYKERAIFPDFTAEALETFMGILWQKPPVIKLPTKLEEMLNSATIQGENLEQLLRRINEQQLIKGRLGLLLDVPTTPVQGSVLPYIALYEAEKIINWDDGSRGEVIADALNLVVLDETEFVRDETFKWKEKDQVRILVYGEVGDNEDNQTAAYSVGVFDGDDKFDSTELIQPSIMGRTLDKIPFSFVNTKDLIADPDQPPLIGLVELCFTIYRGEADYRHALHMQGQDTLVIIGGNEKDNVRVGAGAKIGVPLHGDAKYIGVSSAGLPEMRQAIENDKALAASKAGQIIDTRSKQKESGDALKLRISSETATLNSIARTGAAALEKILKCAAEWVGANPDEVEVIPNLDFTGAELKAKELVDMMTAKQLGAPLSKVSIHNSMKAKGLTSMEYEEELQAIEEEAPDLDGEGFEDDDPESGDGEEDAAT